MHRAGVAAEGPPSSILWATWLGACAIFGSLLLVWRMASPVPTWMLVSVIVAGAGLVALHRTGTPLSAPIYLTLAVFSVRYIVPIVPDPPSSASVFPLFIQMRLTDADWLWGGVLAVTTALSLLLGWMLGRDQTPDELDGYPGRDQGASLSISLAAMCVGLVALGVFIGTNVSLGSALTQGVLRGASIQEGSGVFFHLGLALIPGSVGASFALRDRGHGLVVALLPAVLASSAYFVLGGRARAATPLLAVGLGLWLWHRRRDRPHRLTWTLIVMLSIVFLTWFSYTAVLFRGGLGADAFSVASSPSALARYVRDTYLIDVSQLHALAGVAALPAGTMDGATFLGAATWPISEIVPIGGRSTGIFVLQSTTGLSLPYGLLPSIGGDAYLNFGVLGVILVPLLAGVALKGIDRWYRVGRISTGAYVLTVAYAVRLCTESVQKWPEMLTVLLMWWAIGSVSRWPERIATRGHPAPRDPAQARAVNT
jgi:hypothetical protein